MNDPRNPSVPRRKRWLWLALFGIGFLLLIQEVGYLAGVMALRFQNPKTTAFMDQDAKKKKIYYQFIPYTEISPYLKEAAVVAEDARFFEHNGADWQAMEDALEKNLQRGKWRRGGSTITQQLAKNLYLNPTRTPWRKLRELILSYELEMILSKQRILELYLNVAEWGDGIYGAEVASQTYFHKNAMELSPREAAWMAAILPNPDYFQRHPDNPRLMQKVNMILNRMER